MATNTVPMDRSFYTEGSSDLESRQSQHHDDPDKDIYLSEVADPQPTRSTSGPQSRLEKQTNRVRFRLSSQPDVYGGEERLTELAADAPYPHDETTTPSSDGQSSGAHDGKRARSTMQEPRSRFATEIYVHGYLIFFSILGVLARLGLQALTFYPGAPVITSVIWANFGGSFFLGFLSEDQRLFREEWGTPSSSSFQDVENSTADTLEATVQAAKKKHASVKKTIPLYIGLATGFCGSFTSFSSFMRDAFLALANSLRSPNSPNAIPDRNRGYSATALLAVLLTQTGMSLVALHFGAHTALLLDRFTPSLPFRLCRRFLDPLFLFIAIGSWAAVILLCIFPPNASTWRGRGLFAIAFAPTGCLLRFYISKYLNSRLPSFPLGTFVVNMFGTVVLGMCYDLQHSSYVTALGGTNIDILGCQILQGIMDGFCGALTTVSTWVGELNALKRRHAYIYGGLSIAVGLSFLVVIMGSVRWTRGFDTIACLT